MVFFRQYLKVIKRAKNDNFDKILKISKKWQKMLKMVKNDNFIHFSVFLSKKAKFG